MDTFDEAPRAERGGCLKPLLIGCGVLLLLVIGGGFAIGVLIDRGVIDFQEPKLLRGPEVPGDVLEDLRGFALEEGETLVWFSGLRAFGYNVMGCALTDRRVFAYELEPGQKDSQFEAAALGDLSSVVARFGESAFSETLVQVRAAGADGEEIEVELMLPSDGQLDYTFVQDLVAAARASGATLESIRFGGDVSAEEIEAVEGAERDGTR